jgi:preprotein translocase subunit YajC|tara:strand:- start:191 stop:493 length:303 start_codon:yes stop_codon:yes gene_type:complete
MISPAYAQAAAQQPSMIASFIPLILIFLIFYFLLIRPQQKKQKEHKILLDSIKRGDEILSSGGIVGKVLKADNEKLTVEISKGVNVTIIRATVADVVKKS